MAKSKKPTPKKKKPVKKMKAVKGKDKPIPQIKQHWDILDWYGDGGGEPIFDPF